MRQSHINNRLEELISVISCNTIGDISDIVINNIEYDSRHVGKKRFVLLHFRYIFGRSQICTRSS